MNRLLRKCADCGTYTLDKKCHKCSSPNTTNPHPPKFSPEDKYLRYRMKERYTEPKLEKQ